MAPFLLVSVFLIATCGLVYELIAGALASYLLGDSVLQFSTIIGTYLFAMGVGSYLSKYLTRGLLIPFVQIQLLVGVLGGTSAAVLYMAFGYGAPFRVILYTLVFAVGALVGIEIPLLLRILKDQLDFKDLVSHVLALDYVGALAASVLFPLLLVPQLGMMRTSFLFGMVNVGVALAFAFTFGKERVWLGLKVQAVGAMFLLLAGFVGAERLTTMAEEALYPDEIILTQSTPYQRIAVTRRRNDIRLYLNGNLQFSSADEYRYHEALVYPALAATENPRRVLILGGGDGLAARELLKDDRVESITLVDLDPGVTNLFTTHPFLSALNDGSLRDPRVHVLNADAFVWLENTEQIFDVAIVDFPDPSNYSVGKLYTTHFYRTLKRHLAPGGAATVQCSSPLFARNSYWCIIKTLESADLSVRPYHTYVPSFGEWGFALVSPEPLPQKLAFDRRLSFLNPDQLQAMFVFSEDLARVDAPVNRLFDQALVRQYEEEWRAINE